MSSSAISSAGVLEPLPQGQLDFDVAVDALARRIVVSGELDVVSADLLLRAAEPLLAASGDVTLDLQPLVFICPVGLGAVMRIAIALRQTGDRLRIIGYNPTVARTFRLGGLADLVPVAQTA